MSTETKPVIDKDTLILNDAADEALAIMEKRTPLVCSFNAFKRKYGKKLRDLRRKGLSAEAVIEAYVASARNIDNLSDTALRSFEAQLRSVIDNLEPGWLLRSARKPKASGTSGSNSLAAKGKVTPDQATQRDNFRSEEASAENDAHHVTGGSGDPAARHQSLARRPVELSRDVPESQYSYNEEDERAREARDDNAEPSP